MGSATSSKHKKKNNEIEVMLEKMEPRAVVGVDVAPATAEGSAEPRQHGGRMKEEGRWKRG